MSKTYKILKDNKFSVGGNTPSFRENGGKVWNDVNILKYHMNHLDHRTTDIYDSAVVVVYEDNKELKQIPALDWLKDSVDVTPVEEPEVVKTPKPAAKKKPAVKKVVTKEEVKEDTKPKE